MITIVGPYVGDFEQEILNFRPWVVYLHVFHKVEKMYVNTHFNRFFLYRDFVNEYNLIPVFENLTRDEAGQHGYIHKTIKSRDYNILVRAVKDKVSEIENCNRRDINVENMNYVKSLVPLPEHYKIFTSINHYGEIDNEYKNKIVFIPSNSDRRILLGIKSFLSTYDNFITIGDRKCRFRDDNIILNRIDYIENGWKLLIGIISNAKAVICPLSVWTTICNMQKVPVFSWGNQVSQHKPDGKLYFDNKNCVAIASEDIKVLTQMIDSFLRRVYNG